MTPEEAREEIDRMEAKVSRYKKGMTPERLKEIKRMAEHESDFWLEECVVEIERLRKSKLEKENREARELLKRVVNSSIMELPIVLCEIPAFLDGEQEEV